MSTREYDRRWGDRTPIDDPVMILHGESAWFSRLKDVSPSGCGIARPEECDLGKGAQVRVFFYCENGPALVADGRILRSTDDELGIAYLEHADAAAVG